MARNLCFAFCCFIQIVIFVNGDGNCKTNSDAALYSVVGPGTIRSNYKYNVAVSLHKADGPAQIEVGITGPSYNETKSVNVAPMSTENVEFNVPKLKNGDYNLTAKGVAGIKFENSTRLNYADFKPSTFIQTDKATYKPGDLVQFRVVFLDQNTRPAKIDKPITILINDGAQNRIKQIKDVALTQGVYTGKFQLSEQPVLGMWNIEVVVGGESPETKPFEVAKYVLPKFEVTIDTAKDVAIPDNIIKVTVRAKYTYGKSVKGKATVSIKPSYHYYGNLNDNLEAQKTIDVDGKGHVEFDLNKDLRISHEQSYVPPLKILAVMEEELTGNKQNATATVNLHTERYRIEGIETPYTYEPEKPITFKVVVKNLDGSPVQDTKNVAKLIVDPPRNYFYRGIAGNPSNENVDQKSLVYESKLNEHGIAIFNFDLPNANHSFYSVKCTFLDTTTYLSSLSKYTPAEQSDEPLKLTVKTQSPKLGKDVSIEIKSNEPLKYFVYTIVARGNILKTETVEVSRCKSHTIKFTPTFEMVPRATIFVYYVKGNSLRFDEQSIDFQKEFENSIDISTTSQAKPGEDVNLKITTDPDSFVGLLGVDQSVLLLKSGNDFSKDEIFNSLTNYDTSTPWMRGYGRYPGQQSGVVTMTNANYPYNDGFPIVLFSLANPAPVAFAAAGLPGPQPFFRPQAMPGPPAAPGATFASVGNIAQPPVIRKDFSENWIFQDIANTDKNEFTLAKKIPDTITSWVITGFSLNSKTGFALTENPTKIQVFLPFFVSTNLPYSVKRGEVIAIQVIIFNYMEKTLDAEVTMDNTDGDYEFTEATNEVEENPLDVIKRIKRVSVASNTGSSVSFMIRPSKVGSTTLKITAVTPLAGDSIQQQLKVEPEGVTQYQNRAYFINLKDKQEYKQSIVIEVPANAVPDSEYIEFSVVGDLLGPTIKNIDKLVQMPYGCGEQNMVNFVPNILVLRYLEAIKREMPDITEKAKKFLEIGYQRELTYKHTDGSYSAFGQSDGNGSTWLTAYVARSFRQAANYTDIDPKVIIEALDFLVSKQAENGSFPEYGKLFDSAHQNMLGLTSFVLLAFLENVESTPKYENAIAKGIQYLAENTDKTDDQYSLAIAAVALQQAKSPLAEKVLSRLLSLAKNENDRRWWSKSDEKPTSVEPTWYYAPRSNDVEITAYVLLALLEKENPETALPIIKWLISQRNSNGGFSSTQDTVIGLQALIKFAEKTGSGSGEMDINFVSSGGTDKDKGTIEVSPENSLVLQSHVLPKSTRQVDFTAAGKGSAMVQLAYRFNLAEKEQKPGFKLTTKVKDNTALLNVEVCTEYVLPMDSENKESNMAVMEIGLPSGYTADADSFEDILAIMRVKRVETKNSESTLIVYFESLTAGEVKCLPIKAVKTYPVAKQKPASVIIYDYYDPALKATEFYEVKSSLCDICEGEDCGTGCKKE